MEELRIAFLVIGSVFIVGVLVHGIWKMRKQNEVPERQGSQRIEPSAQPDNEITSDEQGFDELGIGAVRVISEAADTQSEDEVSEDVEAESAFSVEDITDDTAMDHRTEESPAIEEAPEPEPPLYASVVTQPKPHIQETRESSISGDNDADIPEPPEFLLKDAPESKDERAEPDFGLAATLAAPTPPAPRRTDAMARKVPKKRTATKKRKEPTLGEDQMRIDFDEPKVSEPKIESSPSQQNQSEQEQEVLVINVRAAEGEALSGAALLPLLLTLGFKFGDHDIFHRHVNANGKGPVLFSLANMVKPGVFDIDNLETFTTQGISLFMVLPIEGDPHQVFNMMHNAARKIAEEFNAQLLDGRRSILTKQGVQRYMEKIREFERQRIISKSSL